MDHPTPADHDVPRAVVRGARRQLGAHPHNTALELDPLSLSGAGQSPTIFGSRGSARCCSSFGGGASPQRAIDAGALSVEPDRIIQGSETARAGATVDVPFGGEEGRARFTAASQAGSGGDG
jgi:hypothetical protein